MILVIDNYDSFVHNLARFIERAGHATQILRNDEITIEEIEALNPSAIVLSPGPKTPKEAGICIEIVKQLGAHIPILGVCLGHQAIGEACGGQTARGKPMHGKSTEIEHDGTGVFEGLPSPMHVGRYHSLVTQGDFTDLHVNAKSQSGIAMSIQHKTWPVYGVQFHPESILTPHGFDIIRNFVKIVEEWQSLNRNPADNAKAPREGDKLKKTKDMAAA